MKLLAQIGTLAVCLLVAGVATGQNAAVYFDYNQDVLRVDAQKTLDSLLQTQTRPLSAYRIGLLGHTDGDGRKTYNQDLSLRRCQAVAKYLNAKGVLPENIETNGFNFEKPAADNQAAQGKALNRRVEIVLTPYAPTPEKKKENPYSGTGGGAIDIAAIGNPAAGSGSVHHHTVKINRKPLIDVALPIQTTEFAAETGITATYSRSGTVVRIPADILVRADGSPVQGQVQLEYYEMRDAADFIAAGFPMELKGGNIFNSAGMFEIRVLQNGEELFVKPGAFYEMQFQKTEDLPELSFFRYERQTDEWTRLGRLDENSESFDTRTSEGPCFRPQDGFRISARDTVAAFNAVVAMAIDAVKNEGLIFEYLRGNFLKTQQRWESPLYSGTHFVADYPWRNRPLSLETEVDLAKSKLEYTDTLTKAKVGALNNTFLKITLSSADRPDLNVLRSCAWLYLKQGHAYDLETIKTDWKDGKFMAYSGSNKSNGIASRDTVYETVDEDGYLFSQKRQWRDARLSYNGNGSFTLHLKGDGIKQVKVHPEFSGKALSQKAYLKKCAELDQKYREALERYSAAFDVKMDDYRNNWAYFLEFSAPFFTRDEICMGKSEWYRHFDNNHGTVMKARYERMDLIGRTPDSIALAMRTGTLPAPPLTSGNVLGQGLALNGFGVYNCDQIMRLQNPVQFESEYMTMDGRQIFPKELYSVDHRLNTAMTFSPNLPAVNLRSETTFLLVDGNKLYLVRPETIRQALSGKSQQVYTLTAESVSTPVKTADDLRNVLGLTTRR